MASSEKTVRRAPRFRRAAACGNNFFEISGEIPDRGIDLGERDLHTSSLNADSNGRSLERRMSKNRAISAASLPRRS